MPSNPIYVAVNGLISFFFSDSYSLVCVCICRCVYVCVCVYVCMYVYCIFFPYSSVDGNLGRYCTLAMVSNATVNSGVHVSFLISAFISLFLLYQEGSC